MRPGQLEPNELEVAVLERLSLQTPCIHGLIGKLHVLSRKFTGVGSFTEFSCSESASELDEQTLTLKSPISLPRIPNGMGAILFLRKGKPTLLEIFVYGDDHWDGGYDGFAIENIA